MTSWQVWQLVVKVLCIGLILLLEHVLSMPLLSLLLLYWWFGRSHRFSVVPISIYSIVVGLLYGGPVSGLYAVFGLWWWLTAHKLGSRWLHSVTIFSSASLAVLTVFMMSNRVQIAFALSWIVVAGIMWWRLYAGNLGIKHGR